MKHTFFFFFFHCYQCYLSLFELRSHAIYIINIKRFLRVVYIFFNVHYFSITKFFKHVCLETILYPSMKFFFLKNFILPYIYTGHCDIEISACFSNANAIERNTVVFILLSLYHFKYN